MQRKSPPQKIASRQRAKSAPKGLAGGKRAPAAPLPTQREPAAAARKTTLDAPDLQSLWDGYLATRRKCGPDAPELDSWRNALLEQHLPLVRYVAERLARSLPRSLQVEDLVSAGVFGLMDALKGFDPARAVRFKTYAATRVRGAMLDSLRSGDWVPRLVRLRAARIERALAKLAGIHGREPTHAELALELDIPQAELGKELSAARPRVQQRLGDRGRNSDSDSDYEWTLEDERTRTPLEELLAREVLQNLRTTLSHKEHFIVEQYYGAGHTLREIGEMLSLTESRVCQIHTNILGRLRAQCASKRDAEES